MWYELDAFMNTLLWIMYKMTFLLIPRVDI